MKTVHLIRGGQPFPLKLDNGDEYDSVALIMDESGRVIYTDPLVNTDFTEGYKGGILAEGEYYALFGNHKEKYGALNIFRLIPGVTLDNIKSKDDFNRYPATRVLPSLVHNPNNNNNKIITQVNDHAGGTDSYDMHGKLIKPGWDWSHGCISHPTWLYGKWASHFKHNEIVRYIISRAEGYLLPGLR